MKRLLLPLLFISSVALAQADKPEDFRDDWADLRHYAKENAVLPAPAAGEKRVVFLGSSIYEFWKTRMPEYFEQHKNYIDRGISGQIAPQLLIRFQQDVIALKPKAVIILAGSNDLAGTTGHVTIESIMDNVKSMVELAEAHHIKVILCKYLPIYQYPWRKDVDAVAGILALNKAIEAYAAEKKLTILDYFTALKDERNGQPANLTMDGVHPNHDGYVIMAKVTDEAIARALK